MKDLEKYAQMRRKCPTIYHGEELKNRLHSNPYNTYVNNHRIVGTVTDMLYESGSPVNFLEIKTDTVRVSKYPCACKLYGEPGNTATRWPCWAPFEHFLNSITRTFTAQSLLVGGSKRSDFRRPLHSAVLKFTLCTPQFKLKQINQFMRRAREFMMEINGQKIKK